MNVIQETINWLVSPQTWSADGHDMIARSLEHLQYSAIAVAFAAVLAIPAGWFMGHTRRFSGVIVGITGAARALPTLGLVTLFGLLLGIGLVPPMIALVILAIPSILASTYSGISAIDTSVLDAARAQGFTTRQLIARVHLPLGLAMIVGGCAPRSSRSCRRQFWQPMLGPADWGGSFFWVLTHSTPRCYWVLRSGSWCW